MHDISNRILRPISGFLVVVFAKIIIDCVIYYITHWNYPKVIFWQSVIVFFFLFYRYFKKHKIQKKDSESINHLDYTLFKAIQFKVYNSIFVDFIKNNQFLLVLLFLSNASAIDIIQKIREIFFSNLDSIISDNEKVLQTLLPIVIKLREYPDFINFLYSFYFCIIVYIFLNQIDFQTKNDCLQKERKMPRSQLIKDIVENNISLLNIEELRDRNVETLSGGELQKALLARALAQEAKILLLDEPTSALDLNNAVEFMKILKNISIKKEISVIIIIHDLNLASLFCDNLIILKDGKFLKKGNPKEVINEENIKSIYNLDCKVCYNENDKPYIIPIT